MATIDKREASSGSEAPGVAATGRFADRAAFLANQKDDKVVVAVIMSAGDKGVAAFDAMHQAIVAQKIQRTINRDRRRAILRGTVLRQVFDDLVSAERLMARQ